MIVTQHHKLKLSAKNLPLGVLIREINHKSCVKSYRQYFSFFEKKLVTKLLKIASTIVDSLKLELNN